MPILDISALEKSVAALERALDALAETPPTHPHREHLRGATIQCFQVAFETCIRLMTEYADQTEENGILAAGNSDAVFSGVENGLIPDADAWLKHRAMRNQAGRFQDDARADAVAAGAAAFLPDAKKFISALRARADPADIAAAAND